MKPYYDDGGITIYNADCRDVLPTIRADAAIFAQVIESSLHGAPQGNQSAVSGSIRCAPQSAGSAAFCIDPNWEIKIRLARGTRVTEQGCWEWTGTLASGYGVFQWRRGESASAHRTFYENLRGPIPDGMHLDHLCRNRACVNPDHPEPVTPRENSLRMWAHRGR